MLNEQTPASPAEEQDTEALAEGQAAEAQDVAAGSSPQDEKPAKPDLLSVVQDAVKTPAEAAEGTSSPEAEKEGEAPEGEGEAKAEPTPEEDANLPFGKHPRFKAILTERNGLREQVATLKAPAEQYERIEAFMQHNGLTNEHVVELFRVGALMRTDPDKAYEAVADYLVELGRVTGRSLPHDLREDVDNGRITEERAAELSRERAKASRLETARVEDGQRRTAEQTATNVASIRSKVAEWEASTRASDPDFKAKEKLIADRVQALAAQKGTPKTPDDAVALTAQAHREISAELKAALPKRPSIARPPVSGSSAAATPAPKSLHEAIAAAVQT